MEDILKIKLRDIEEIPVNDFSKLNELIEKKRFELGVNLSFKRNTAAIKELFKFSDYILIKLTEYFPYLLMLILILDAYIFSNYYLLIGLPLFFILKNSGILDVWILVLINVVLLIIILIFKIGNPTFYVLLIGSLLTYIASKISFKIFINKLKKNSLQSEKNFCLAIQMHLISITDVRKNETYTIENKKSP